MVKYNKDGKEEIWECNAVAICSGLHVEPSIPAVKGIEHVPKVLHSSQFKSREDFGDDKNIMVLGVGETAMDISHLAVTGNTKSVTLCHRGGFVYAPKVYHPSPFVSYCRVLTKFRSYPSL